MDILESGEDYLERILILKERNGIVRSIDIANDMHFSKPSISIAMKKLKENQYILIDDDGLIELTNKGLLVAQKIYDRHVVLTKFLLSIGVNEEIAKKDACKIEHDLSEETFAAIKKQMKK